MSFYESTGLSDDSTREIARLMKAEGNAYEQDGRLIVKFYTGSLCNNTKSTLAGRPIFDDIEKVRILKIGERDYIDKGSNSEYERRFPKQYEAFKRGEESKASGTPLSMWPVLKASQVQELAYFNVHTIEQLAEMPDIHLSKFMGGQSLRQAAQEYAARAVTQAPLLAIQAQVEERDAKISAMQAQMEQMSMVMAGLQANAGLHDRPVASAVAAPEGAVPYRGPVFPVAPEAMATHGAAPKRRGRPPKAQAAP